MNLQFGGENIFFLIKISKMIILQKNFLLYFLTKNTTDVEQFFFLKISNGGLIKMAIFFSPIF
jgi:hypothetical protein